MAHYRTEVGNKSITSATVSKTSYTVTIPTTNTAVLAKKCGHYFVKPFFVIVYVNRSVSSNLKAPMLSCANVYTLNRSMCQKCSVRVLEKIAVVAQTLWRDSVMRWRGETRITKWGAVAMAPINKSCFLA